MKKYNIGFVGSGKMAGAIIKGLLKSNFTTSEYLLATQAEAENIKEKSSELGIEIILDNKILAQKSDVIFIATKPNQVVDVLNEISPFVTPEKLEVKHREILSDIAQNYSTKEQYNDLKVQLSNMQAKIDKIYDVIIEGGKHDTN